MSVTRACVPCRTAKARCDFVRPACGRCVQRGLRCHGFPDEQFIFVDERESAQRNSERARRESRPSPPTASFEIAPSQPQLQATPWTLSGAEAKQLYSWLNAQGLAQVPQPLKRDPSARAVDHFFTNWILYPTNDGASTGFMHTLPALYVQSGPDSALGFAIRAIAAADKKHYYDGDTGISFRTTARRNYGEALTHLRQLAGDAQKITEDCTLATLMLIDAFEEVYLARSEPLGLHGRAVDDILRLRGDGQFFNHDRFAAWRLAYDRLQLRQIIFREGPSAEQITWFGRLNLDAPELRMCADKMRVNILCAEARRLIEGGAEQSGDDGQAERAATLVQEMKNLVSSIEAWMPTLTRAMEVQEVTHEQLSEAEAMSEIAAPLPYTILERGLLFYRDITTAHRVNFFASAQVVLRESLIEVLEYAGNLRSGELQDTDWERIEQEGGFIAELSDRIIRSFSQLLGFTRPGAPSLPKMGIMAGRFFILFSIQAIQRASHAPQAHKEAAVQIAEWIRSTHGLE
ncbi:hypothetical protein BAUCODRAFT_417190 [Baudoinia panamericana UAMH 10762]|uniref:Zn(2)-C6 fungal-type domain-containing protein n=1 Tax=Baudoinia panamericana (strain UAMH 10762) TaxID=717646 RepID=M2NGU5_BAUPA|nr:uncharacterized protein BAUCODRAFT_417190 [Baudoinia panamericana UAMH 10762]EMC98235.1 hypothetical protein BAUCODRAFT_417190 [Baudoinia panamericana UAMH 10762]